MVVRRLRERQNLSQNELAKRAKVSQSYLSKLEAGERGKSVSVRIVQRLAKALGVPVTELLE